MSRRTASAISRASSLTIEQLETRRFLSVSLADRVLTVVGTDNADEIAVTLDAQGRLVVQGAGNSSPFALDAVSEPGDILSAVAP